MARKVDLHIPPSSRLSEERFADIMSCVQEERDRQVYCQSSAVKTPWTFQMPTLRSPASKRERAETCAEGGASHRAPKDQRPKAEGGAERGAEAPVAERGEQPHTEVRRAPAGIRLPKLGKFLFPTPPSMPRTQKSKPRPQSEGRVLSLGSATASSDLRSRSPRNTASSSSDDPAALWKSEGAEPGISAQGRRGRFVRSFGRTFRKPAESIPEAAVSSSSASGAAVFKSEGAEPDFSARGGRRSESNPHSATSSSSASGATLFKSAIPTDKPDKSTISAGRCDESPRHSFDTARPSFDTADAGEAIPLPAKSSSKGSGTAHAKSAAGQHVDVRASSARTFKSPDLEAAGQHVEVRASSARTFITPNLEETMRAAMFAGSSETGSPSVKESFLGSQVTPGPQEGGSDIFPERCHFRKPSFPASMFDQYYEIALGGEMQVARPTPEEVELDDALQDAMLDDDALRYDLGEALWGHEDDEDHLASDALFDA